MKDPLLFVAFACLVFWILSLAAGYWLVRHNNVLAAIIPSSIVVVLVQAYADYQRYASWWLAVYLLIVLLLIGREYYRQSQKGWSQRRVFIGEGAWTNILGGLFTTAALAILIAWLIPTSLSSLQSAANSWNNFTKPVRERLSNAVSSLNGPYSAASGNFYGNTLSVGQNAATGDATLFTVDVLNPPDSALRYYWRGRAYDTYSNGQWSNAPASNLDFVPGNGDIKIPDADNRSPALLQFTMQFPTQYLVYAPSQPVWVDRPAKVFTTVTDTKLYDALDWEAQSAVHAGGQYRVRSEIADPNILQLQAAGTTYPQWITDRYLQIPDQLRPEMQSLAEKVTAGQQNPYGKASAITDYLRATLQYSTNVPAAPPGKDAIAWVLFDYKKGFCNYYASAEVLLLRSIGIPARLAVGFAQGEHQNDRYIIRMRDAHAWPEVYFPGIGWVEFEPTVSQAALVRPSAVSSANGLNGSPPILKKPNGSSEDSSANTSKLSTTAKALPFTGTVLGRTLIIGLSLIGLMTLAIVFRRYHVLSHVPVYLSRTFESGGMSAPVWIETWSQWNQLLPVERSFASINWSLRWLGKPQSMDATPAERAALLKKLLPIAAVHIETLKSELEFALYTQRPADVRNAWCVGLVIIYFALRDRLFRFLGLTDDHDVYSG